MHDTVVARAQISLYGAHGDAGRSPGTYGKTVTGSASTGNWVMYAKVNPGAWIKWHWRSNPQTLYVVSGTMD
jgi:mannose-6-phosphate isomerase-like protein (cupin superfamily)